MPRFLFFINSNKLIEADSSVAQCILSARIAKIAKASQQEMLHIRIGTAVSHHGSRVSPVRPLTAIGYSQYQVAYRV